MSSYYYIPIYIFAGYLAGKIFSWTSKDSKIKSRFKLTNYNEIYQNEIGNKIESKEQSTQEPKKSFIRRIFSKKKKDSLLQEKQISSSKTYLVYDFDQLNDKSKINTYIGKTKDNSQESTFEELSFFVSYIICNFDSEKTEILLRISSPGGCAYSFERARDEFLRLKNHGFMTTAFVDDVCASGGYMLACACQKIICTETSKIGSVGVLTPYVNFHDILEKIGITKKMIGTSEYKHIPNFTGEKETEKHQELIKGELDYTLDMFLGIISLSREDVDLDFIKTAKVWYGKDALEHKLVDGIDNIDDHMLKLSKDKSQENKIWLVTSNDKEEDKSMTEMLLKKVMNKKMSKLF